MQDDAIEDAAEDRARDHPDRVSGASVIATTAAPLPGLVLLQLMVFFFLFLSLGFSAVREPETRHVLMTVLFGMTAAGYAWMAVGGHRAHLVLGPDVLLLRRRFRSVSVARGDVVSVRGDVPGRPSWSHRVIIETPRRTVVLPELDRSPAVLVPRLQEWAGLGE